MLRVVSFMLGRVAGSKTESDVLAVVATEAGLGEGLSGLVQGLGLLGLEGNALLAIGGDADGLVVDKTSVLQNEKWVSNWTSISHPLHPCLSHPEYFVPCGSAC